MVNYLSALENIIVVSHLPLKIALAIYLVIIGHLLLAIAFFVIPWLLVSMFQSHRAVQAYITYPFAALLILWYLHVL